MNKTEYGDVKEFNNLKEMLEESTEEFGNRPAFFVRNNKSGEYYSITYKEFKKDIDSLGTALISMGLKNRKIAVVGENSYECAMIYMATINGVGCLVPLDKELPENELESLLVRLEVSAVFFTDKKKTEIINISKRISNIKYYISMNSGDPQNIILDFHEIVLIGKKLIENNDMRFIDRRKTNEKL